MKRELIARVEVEPRGVISTTFLQFDINSSVTFSSPKPSYLMVMTAGEETPILISKLAKNESVSDAQSRLWSSNFL